MFATTINFVWMVRLSAGGKVLRRGWLDSGRQWTLGTTWLVAESSLVCLVSLVEPAAAYLTLPRRAIYVRPTP